MVEIMLINTHNNLLNIVYKQKINVNKINRKKENKIVKTYEYKEVNIPVELITYWKDILKQELNTLYLVTYYYNGIEKNFITPLEVTYETDITGLKNDSENIINPERIVEIPVRTHGTPKDKKYFIRHSKNFTFTEDFLTWTVNPYLNDPVMKTRGLVSIDNTKILAP